MRDVFCYDCGLVSDTYTLYCPGCNGSRWDYWKSVSNKNHPASLMKVVLSWMNTDAQQTLDREKQLNALDTLLENRS